MSKQNEKDQVRKLNESYEPLQKSYSAKPSTTQGDPKLPKVGSALAPAPKVAEPPKQAEQKKD